MAERANSATALSSVGSRRSALRICAAIKARQSQINPRFNKGSENQWKRPILNWYNLPESSGAETPSAPPGGCATSWRGLPTSLGDLPASVTTSRPWEQAIWRKVSPDPWWWCVENESKQAGSKFHGSRVAATSKSFSQQNLLPGKIQMLID